MAERGGEGGFTCAAMAPLSFLRLVPEAADGLVLELLFWMNSEDWAVGVEGRPAIFCCDGLPAV